MKRSTKRELDRWLTIGLIAISGTIFSCMLLIAADLKSYTHF